MLFTITLEYQGKQYTYQQEFTEVNSTYNTPEELVEYLYTEGNYACDCNRSAFIAEYCDDDFPELECGREIKLISLDPRPVYHERTVYIQQASGLYISTKMQGEYVK